MLTNWVEKLEGYRLDVAGNMSLKITSATTIKIIQL